MDNLHNFARVGYEMIACCCNIVAVVVVVVVVVSVTITFAAVSYSITTSNCSKTQCKTEFFNCLERIQVRLKTLQVLFFDQRNHVYIMATVPTGPTGNKLKFWRWVMRH
uniref:Transmembrane protein n=1 Tax=Glossina austeni TaxID=7395 RepID=A0A1A9UQJ2_GLOAU